MINDAEDAKLPALKVVSDNPNAPDKARREIARAKEQAQQALANVAATILRTMAGSESAPP